MLEAPAALGRTISQSLSAVMDPGVNGSHRPSRERDRELPAGGDEEREAFRLLVSDTDPPPPAPHSSVNIQRLKKKENQRFKTLTHWLTRPMSNKVE